MPVSIYQQYRILYGHDLGSNVTKATRHKFQWKEFTSFSKLHDITDMTETITRKKFIKNNTKI